MSTLAVRRPRGFWPLQDPWIRPYGPNRIVKRLSRQPDPTGAGSKNQRPVRNERERDRTRNGSGQNRHTHKPSHPVGRWTPSVSVGPGKVERTPQNLQSLS